MRKQKKLTPLPSLPKHSQSDASCSIFPIELAPSPCLQLTSMQMGMSVHAVLCVSTAKVHQTMHQQVWYTLTKAAAAFRVTCATADHGRLCVESAMNLPVIIVP